MIQLIEKYLFRVRHVFITYIKEYELLTFPSENEITVRIENLKNFKKIRYVFSEVYEEKKMIDKFMKRARDTKLWKLVVAYSKDKPVGVFWIMIPKNTILYDSFVFQKKDLLFCSVFVKSNQRGNRIYNHMHRVAFEFWKKKYSQRRVITIVAKSNIASFKSNARIGLRVRAKNYLVKIVSINILSLYIEGKKILLWFLPLFKQIRYE